MIRLTPCLLLVVLSGACAPQGDDGPADCTSVFYADGDGDGFGNPAITAEACEAPIGFVAKADDCDDADDAVHPGAPEVCNGVDDNCDARVDSDDPTVDPTTERAYYRDRDGDGFGDSTDSTTSCDRPDGYVTDDTDCDDGAVAVNPAATEVCDQIDDDCDQLIDDDDDSLSLASATSFYLDVDRDGYGAGNPLLACQAPSGYVTQAGDCDDGVRDAHPGATELCDGRDDDCDTGIDGTPAAPNQCGGYAGTYAGTYSNNAEEKVGSVIVNQMHCTAGTSSITVNLTAATVVEGSLQCSYSGGLIAFDGTQHATLDGTLALDGSFRGTLHHDYASDIKRSYTVTGTIAGGQLTIDGTSTLLPNPMSTVPWQVDYHVEAGD